jgi:hypothetical protein
MIKSHITDEHIKELDNFNAWLKKEIINKEIFTCNHQVDRKNNIILINKGKMILEFYGQWIGLKSSSEVAIIHAEDKLHQILMDGLIIAIKEHFVKTYQA